MSPMRSVPLAAPPGEREIAAFAELISRPLVIVGNGPSAAFPPYRRLPDDPVIFRMNWFFLESHYHFGSQVDGWFFAVPNEVLEKSLREEIRTRRYQIDRVLSPMQMSSRRDGERWGNELLGLPVEEYDHWAVIARSPRLARYFMSRPGLPTSGMQALGFGLGVGFRDVYLSGFDLYESKEARYGYVVTQQAAAGLVPKDLAPGYEKAHSIDNDLAFLKACLTEFPDAQVSNLSDSVNLGLVVAEGRDLVGRATMTNQNTPHLGEPKDHLAFTLAESGRAGAVVVKAPSDARLWQDIDGRRCAFVTVVSGNYHHGTRALANSLRKVSDVPLLALCTSDVDHQALTASGVHVIAIPEILNPNTAGMFQKRFAATYTKLNVFRLDFLDRLVYLDSDTVVLKNIDDLFTGEDFAAVPDAGFDRPTTEVFNSGVFAVNPSFELFEDLMNRLAHTPSRDGGDQGFLNNIFTDWQCLPPEYNTTKRVFAHHPGLYNAAEVKVVHYVGIKPWEPAKRDDRYSELDLDWLEHLETWELRELVRDLRHEAAETRLVLPDRSAPLALRSPMRGSPLRQAQQLNAARRYPEAEAVLREAWTDRAATKAELREIAVSLRHLGRYGETVRFLRSAARLAPQSRGIAVELQVARARLAAGLFRRVARALRTDRQS